MSNTSAPLAPLAPSQISVLPRIRLGLCCINNTLRAKKIYTNRTCIRKTYTPEKGHQLALQNVTDLLPILEWNHARGIKHFRISSDMFPHLCDPECQPYELCTDIECALMRAGEFATTNGHRLTMHPGQYNVIGTPRREVFEATIKDLTQHAYVLDMMNAPIGEGVLCIHGGGVYGDKERTIRRWIDQFDELPTCVKQRLAIENCEKSYNVFDCLEIAEACRIPVIFDTHHDLCYKLYHPDQPTLQSLDEEGQQQLLSHIAEGWQQRSARPLFHISDPKDPCSDLRKNQMFCAHHDYIKEIPKCLLVASDIGGGIDIEVEAKAKEAAIFRLMDTKEYRACF